VGIVGAEVAVGAVGGASVTTMVGSGLFSLSPYELFDVQDVIDMSTNIAMKSFLTLSIRSDYNDLQKGWFRFIYVFLISTPTVIF
jgi:hypothetical protein